MESVLIRAISWFASLIEFMLLARAILSWFVHGSRSGLTASLYSFFEMMTEPFVMPCRALLSRFGNGVMDWSVFLSFFFVSAIATLLKVIVGMIF